jgi:hypothetical protein
LYFCLFYFGHYVVCTFVSFILAIVLSVRRSMVLVYTILYRQTFLMFEIEK